MSRPLLRTTREVAEALGYALTNSEAAAIIFASSDVPHAQTLAYAYHMGRLQAEIRVIIERLELD